MSMKTCFHMDMLQESNLIKIEEMPKWKEWRQLISHDQKLTKFSEKGLGLCGFSGKRHAFYNIDDN